MALDLPIFLVQLVGIVAGAGLTRALVVRVGQPAVLGDLVFGIAVGPTLFGRLAPEARASMFPSENAPALTALAWLGLVLFMFIAGAEMRWKGAENRAILLVAAGGLIVPLTFGLGLGLLRPDWFFDGGPSVRGVTLVATVLAVSALPVLARILDDVHLLGSPLGTIVMGAGTVDDLVGWTVLALVAGHAVGLTGGVVWNLLLIGGLLILALVADRAVTKLLAGRALLARPALFGVLVVVILAAAWLTDRAGLHAIIGPLAVGAVVSRHPRLREYARTRLGDLTTLLFLPVFFVLSGADADLGLLGYSGLVAMAVVLVAASLGKILGAYLGGRAADMTARASIVTGLLLNARGAVGLVVAKVGLDAGLLSSQGYALLVVVIVLTTMMAPPALRFYVRRLPASAAT